MKRIAHLGFLICTLLAAIARAADQQNLSITDKESLQLESELSWMTYLLWGMVAALMLFAVAIRYIARSTTHPCPWCSEFIPNSAQACPRCGKSLAIKKSRA